MATHPRTAKLSFLLFLVSGVAFATPKITRRAGQVGRLDLGPAVTDALKRFDPDFKPFAAEAYLPAVQEDFKSEAANETPMAVIGDFNGDGHPDVAVMGRSRDQQLVLAALSSGKNYAVVRVDQQPFVAPEKSFYPPEREDESNESEAELPRQRGLNTYLTLVRAKGRGEEPDVKRFRHDALTIETFRGASHLFYCENGKFREWKPTAKP